MWRDGLVIEDLKHGGSVTNENAVVETFIAYNDRELSSSGNLIRARPFKSRLAI